MIYVSPAAADFQRHVAYMLPRFGAYKWDNKRAGALWKEWGKSSHQFPCEYILPFDLVNSDGKGCGIDADGNHCTLIEVMYPKPGHSRYELEY